MSKWLKEPLLHFLLLGALIFLVYGWLSDERSADEIFISTGQQDTLINTFARSWQRPPTPAEFKGLLDDFVREEIAYREAKSLGLDDNDVIIRRRLRQKLELLAEDIAGLSVPSDAELQAFLDDNQNDYLIEPRYSLQQIYFSTDRREDAAGDAEALLAELQSASKPLDYSQLGDSIALPEMLENTRLSEITRVFGGDFSAELEQVESGQWAGPVQSGFGLHLILVTGQVPAQKPGLDQVRDAVQRDWFSVRRQEAVDGLYQRLAGNYTIEIEPPETGLPADGLSVEGAAEQ
jgi:hypothetical protein